MILRASQVADRLASKDAQDPLAIVPTPDIGLLKKSYAAAVDLRLGTWFVTLRPSKAAILDVLSKDTPTGPASTQTHFIPFGDRFVLHPGCFVLGVTLEWIRVPTRLAAYVVGKSSWGRRGLIIATAVGVHPGFAGCLTLELSNVGEVPIAVRPGMEICQIFFHTIVESSEEQPAASAFVGYRRPVLGEIKIDDVARKLAAALDSENPNK